MTTPQAPVGPLWAKIGRPKILAVCTEEALEVTVETRLTLPHTISFYLGSKVGTWLISILIPLFKI